MKILMDVHEDAPSAGGGVRMALFQTQGRIGDAQAVRQNLETMETIAGKAKDHAAHLVVFPELFLSGYGLDADSIGRTSVTVDGETMVAIGGMAKRHGIAIAAPYSESAKHPRTGDLTYFDSIALFDGDGALLENYRKTHLFGEHEKRLFAPGDKISEIHVINGVKIAILNCYEAEFPEITRMHARRGAAVIIIPTADSFYDIPSGRRAVEPYPDVANMFLPSTSFGNAVFMGYANRCGSEIGNQRTWTYRGNSMVTGPHGNVLLRANAKEESLLICDCRPSDYGPVHDQGDYLRDARIGFVDTLL